MNNVKVPISCERCNEKEWCDSLFGGEGCFYKENVTKELLENTKQNEGEEKMKVKKNKKACFGQYENWDNSWHCKGCVVCDECKEYTELLSQEEQDGEYEECEECKIEL